MQLFEKHCVVRIQIFRPITVIQRRTSVRQSKLSDVLNLIFILCVLSCLFQQTAPAQEIHIPEPVPPPTEVSEAFGLDTSFLQTVDRCCGYAGSRIGTSKPVCCQRSSISYLADDWASPGYTTSPNRKPSPLCNNRVYRVEFGHP